MKVMASLFTKEKRIIYIRRIKGFWEEFSRKKIGLLGLAMVIVYAVLGVFGPWIAPYPPMSFDRVAKDFAMPEWVTIFPQYRNLTKTQENLLYWNVAEKPPFIDVSYGRKVQVLYETSTTDSAEVELITTFSYLGIPPDTFSCRLPWGSKSVKNMSYYLRLTLFTPNGTRWRLWSQQALSTVWSEDVYIESVEPTFRKNLGFKTEENPAPIIMSEKGNYTLRLLIHFTPTSEEATCQVNIENAKFIIYGHVHGILGCDYSGVDVFSQVVHGARISLIIGLLSAIAGASIGIVVGVITGYLGGIVDEIMMRVVDILLCLPLLPLLLTLTLMFGRSVYYVVLFITIFGWQGLARMIRSAVLSIRETAFVECARAAGASRFYIMMRHLVPNILPVAFASLVLRVPAAILFEASLSFLGFGDPMVPTWGKMLQFAFRFGAFVRLAWWWLVPPGLAITTLCLAFVFMGHAVDEVVNPRLRRRR
jgi:peptide/nickel transport system permease protein